MADLSLVTDKYFTIASETFTDNLSSSIAAGAATVPVLNNSEYTNGDDVVLTVDPGTVNEATFIGRKSGLNFINCVWTEGNLAVGHSNGATIIDYDSATHHNAQTKGILKFATSAGALLTQPVRDALGLGATAANGWEVAPYTFSVSTGYNKGNREFDITVANADVTTIYSEGQRLRFTRGTTPDTQCATLVSASSQYFSRASASITGTIATVTDDITTEIWAKPATVTTAMGLISRVTATNGWQFYINSTGQVAMTGFNGGAGNYRLMNTLNSVIPSEWVQLSGTLDMSGWTTATNAIYMNGISVPVVLTSAGTNPTAWVNSGGNLEVGSMIGANFFNGQLSDARVWNVIRTQTQIRDNQYNQLVGSETNLIFYAKLANSVNDSTSSANHLTANGGAVTTTVDFPYTATEYAIIVKKAYSAPNTTLTVISSTLGGIPNQTLTAPYYSAQKTPYGFPSKKEKWTWQYINRTQASQTTAVLGTWYSLHAAALQGSAYIVVPTGAWDLGYDLSLQTNAAGAASTNIFATLSTANNTESDTLFTEYTEMSTATIFGTAFYKSRPISVATATPYYLNTRVTASGASPQIYNRGDIRPTIIFATSTYL